MSKIALITGANKGIGKEIARQLGAQGMTVLIGARDAQRGEEAAAELKANGADAQAITLDVTDEASISAAAAKIEKDYGRLDVLVNNAGIALDRGPPAHSNSPTCAALMRPTSSASFPSPKPSCRSCRSLKRAASSTCPAASGH